MTDSNTPPSNDRTNRRTKKNIFTTSLALTTAAIAGLAAFLDDTDKIKDHLKSVCQYVTLCAAAPTPPPTLPILQGYDSPEMGGGHDQAQQCGPLLAKYQAENPTFIITLNSWEDSNKDWLAHVTYRYHCRYAATPK